NCLRAFGSDADILEGPGMTKLVRPAYDETEAPTLRTPPTGLAGPAGLLIGLLTLVAPDIAKAAEGPIEQAAAKSGGMGMTEIAVITGISVLLAAPFFLKKIFAKPPPPSGPPPATRDNPVKVKQDGKTTSVHPYTKSDMKNAADLSKVMTV